MKNSLKDVLIGTFYGILICGLISLVVDRFALKNNVHDDIRDTVIDTITFRQPIPVDSVVVRYKTVALRRSAVDTLYAASDTVYLTRTDSVSVEVPITQKVYKDSTYTAWVSGFMPNLDSIRVYKEMVTIDKRYRKKWNVGIQAGYGYGFGYRGFEPYIGIGIVWNPF